MTKIPTKLRAQLAEDPFYQTCCISGDKSARGDRVEWHHNLIFGGKQVQARFAILPLKKSLHLRAGWDKDLRAQLDWIMWNRATPEEIKQYSKAVDYGSYLAALNCTYGVWVDGPIEAGILY